jgi:hypothetical protein
MIEITISSPPKRCHRPEHAPGASGLGGPGPAMPWPVKPGHSMPIELLLTGRNAMNTKCCDLQ